MGRRRQCASRAAERVGAVAAVVIWASGCSPSDRPDDTRTPSPESAALRVQTVSGADQLDERTRIELEGAVGDVLSSYVVGAFLGDFPREEFVSSFESFTSGAARDAAADIDRLTAAGIPGATAVQATELEARLSFLTQGRTVHGGTATVHFAFDATMQNGTTLPLTLDGRLLLVADGDEWSVVGYDVAFDDGEGVPAVSGSSSESPSGPGQSS